MNSIRKIKGILGFCQADGCWKRSKYIYNFPQINVKRDICGKHAEDLVGLREVNIK